MQFLLNLFYSTSDFLDSGGPVVKVLVWVILCYWLLAYERLLYLRFTHRHLAGLALSDWITRPDLESWSSRQIREARLSRLDLAAQYSIPLIRTLVALCPLLGLLGTVTGMITIFDVMAIKGTGNARSMAEGVSRATIPTMAGMVAALAGVFVVSLIVRNYEQARNLVRNGFSASKYASTDILKLRAVELGVSLRFAIALLMSVLTTIGLLLLMQGLIATGKAALTKQDTLYFVDFIRVPQEQEVQRKERRLKKPQSVERPPEIVQAAKSVDDLSGDNVIAVSMPSVDGSLSDVQLTGLTGLAASDGDYLPVVKVEPVYPRSALSRGLEGYVLLQFTVTTTGSVRDPVVVESSSTLFERAAIAAALKFKYKPRIVDGEPIEVHGVLNKITFLILDE